MDSNRGVLKNCGLLKHCNPFILPVLTRIDWDDVTWQSGMDSASVSTLEEGDTKDLDSDDDDGDDVDFVPRIRVRYMCISKDFLNGYICHTFSI